MASNLIEYSKDILQANKHDLEEATKGGWIKLFYFNLLSNYLF